ncbi:MAG: hypothetical protein KAU20_00075 [Nanoarchaeota archaeon]|nr:hypothetical protein [Nanoarchaeota archaeon]
MKTGLFFDVPKEDPMYSKFEKHVLYWSRNPDKGSEFDKKTKDSNLEKISDSEFLRWLKSNNYDIFLGYDKEVYGHFAFEKQNDELHIFSFFRDKKYKGKGVFMQIAYDFLDNAIRREGISKVRISKGENEKAKKLLRIYSRKEEDLGIKVDIENGWIDLLK